MTAPNDALPYRHRRAIEEVLINVGPRVMVQQIAAQLREQAMMETRDGNLELASDCILNATLFDFMARDLHLDEMVAADKPDTEVPCE